ncbi:hypothetical protein [Litorilituus lipolyticus]|uniref:Uncharacterized protein n=1 Tax=Litorilituus lipolyticus TaxID=2491017 RepID=A0A502L0M2_9GAMM|nr:hypothetical protein [Litorilituus lipolyticus]TPH14047.1 hypothetical protein EPA86_13150 [Litorilituus lipolyticus]
MNKTLLYFTLGAIAGYFSSNLVHHLTDESSIEQQASQQEQVKKTITKKVEHIQTSPQQPSTELGLNKPKNKSHTSSSKVNELEKQIISLKKANDRLKRQYQKQSNHINTLTHEIESIDESEITDAQMVALKSDGFEKFRRQFRGKQRDDIYQFHQEEADLNWGYNMQTALSDFIQTHLNASYIRLHDVTCKINRCELLVTQLEQNAWESIMKDITKQPWWRFRSTHSSSMSGDSNHLSFYLYLIE